MFRADRSSDGFQKVGGHFLTSQLLWPIQGMRFNHIFLIAGSPRVLLGKTCELCPFLEFWYVLSFLMYLGSLQEARVKRETKLCFKKKSLCVWKNFGSLGQAEHQGLNLRVQRWSDFQPRHGLSSLNIPASPPGPLSNPAVPARPMENGLWYGGENHRNSTVLCGNPFCRSSYGKQMFPKSLEREKNSQAWQFRGNQLALSG